MQIKVQIVGEPDNVPSSERKSITVETHARRGDMFNILKNDAVMQGGDGTVFTVPVGGRLVITTPDTHEELVYDRDQGAAIRQSQQDTSHGADKPATDAPVQPSAPARAAATTPPANPQTSTPPQVQRGVPATAPSGGGTRTSPQPNATEAAKAAQQSAPRPAGESPPLPGSPIGSPPAGNEGRDNK